LTDFGLIKQMAESNPARNNDKSSDRERQYELIKEDAAVVYRSGTELQAIIDHNKKIKDVNAQRRGMNNITLPMTKGFVGLTINQIYAINNFIIYGTKSTQILGEGERAGIVNSFKSAFGKFPTSNDEWQDCISIGNGRWPKIKSPSAESKANTIFLKIYKRKPDMNRSKDNAAVTILSYGLRPIKRKTESENNAIQSFRSIFKHSPANTIDWDTVRAIAYSGASR